MCEFVFFENKNRMENEIAKEVFGNLGLLFWSFQLTPQVIQNWRAGDTGTLSFSMTILWALWTPFFAAGAIHNNLAPPLIIQPNLFGFFAAVCSVQVYWYRRKSMKSSYSLNFKLVLSLIIFCIILACLEFLLFFIISICAQSTVTGVQAIAVIIPSIAPFLVVLGFIPQFVEIYQAKTCHGISPIFILLDILGGVFSIISLVFHPPPFDIVSSLSYAGVITMDLVIVLMGLKYGWTLEKPIPSTDPN
jgi:uncharacterized protein with PQ loop repeat